MQVSDTSAKLELWFFRDMLESNRLRLFGLFGFNPSEMDTLAKQQMVFRRILDALSVAEPVKTAPAVAVPTGWKLVPLVPTSEMIDAWRLDQAQGRSLQSSYVAMLAASPTPPAEKEGGE